jgi:disulfide bond formation protein DsbB
MSQMQLDPAPGKADASWLLLFASWLTALTSTLGALFIGEVMGQAPCVLCWYQRIFMFPLAVFLAIACLRSDVGVWHYALPLTLIGWLIAAFHMLQYSGAIPAAMTPCTASGPSCSGEGMTILGRVPIPALSLLAFTAIAVLLTLTARRPAP